MNIMIVDPSELSRNVVESLIMKMGVKALDIHLFIDGNSALEYIRENDADVIFTSLSLSGVDGVDLIDLMLKSDPTLVSKLFVISSSDKEALDDVKGIGAKRFIKKPINEDYFIHFVQPEIERIISGQI